jgi:dolichol-phosphate mannosyltransferase
MAQSRTPECELSVLVQDVAAGSPVGPLLADLRRVISDLGVSAEILLLAHAPDAAVHAAAAAGGARVVEVPDAYGGALRAGFDAARGTFVLTMDDDLSHPPSFIRRLWAERDQADVTIASRYVPGGSAEVDPVRRAGSRLVNALFSRGLDVPVRDLSSGFRLYRASTIREQPITSDGLDVLQQTVVQAFTEGWRVREVPFAYRASRRGLAHRRIAPVAWAWTTQFGRLWKRRNSILAADYDDRAHDSRIPLQRYWQRQRHRHVLSLVAGEGRVLDVGCGSSRIIAGLPPGSVAADVLQRKLRYARRFGRALVRASGFALPFADASFPCVLCSQVIEHVPKSSPILDELVRVLAPGGRLVLGTPDYANWQWVYIEKLYGLVPGGYKDEHISHYTNRELVAVMEGRGLRFEEERYILRGELIQAYRKPRA